MTIKQSLMRLVLSKSIVALVASLGASGSGLAAEYPSRDRPIRLLVGYGTGGGTDRLARVFAKAMSDEMGSPVIVDDRAGATGTIAANMVAKAKPDGLTLLFSAGSDVTVVKYTVDNLPYDIYHDFAPIARVAQTPYVIVTNDKVPGTSLADLLAYIKAQPSPPAVAAGATISRLTADLFRIRTKLPMETILYGGTTTPMNDLLGNQLQISVDVMPSVLPQVRAGALKPRAVAAQKRSPLMPDVPTMIESGFPNFVSTVWYCVLAPKNTPEPIVQKLNSVLRKLTSTPAIQKMLLDQGYEAYENDSPEELNKLLADETRRWGEVIRLSGGVSK